MPRCKPVVLLFVVSAFLVVIAAVSWALLRETPGSVIKDVDAVAESLGMDARMLAHKIASADMEPHRGGDPRVTALAVWSGALRNKYSRDPAEIRPYFWAIEEYQVIPHGDPLAIEDPDKIMLGLGGLWCLARAWREVGVYGSDLDELGTSLERIAFDRDETIRMGVGLVTTVVIDELGDKAPATIHSAHDIVMQNDLVDKMVRDKMAAMDDDIRRHGNAP